MEENSDKMAYCIPTCF